MIYENENFRRKIDLRIKDINDEASKKSVVVLSLQILQEK